MRVVWLANDSTYSGSERSTIRVLAGYFKYLNQVGVEIVAPTKVTLCSELSIHGIKTIDLSELKIDDIVLASYVHFSPDAVDRYTKVYNKGLPVVFYDSDNITVVGGSTKTALFNTNLDFISRSTKVITCNDDSFPPSIYEPRDLLKPTNSFRYVGNLQGGCITRMDKIFSEVGITDVIKYGHTRGFSTGVTHKVRKKFEYSELLDFLSESGFGVHLVYPSYASYAESKHITLKVKEYTEAGVPVLDDLIYKFTSKEVTEILNCQEKREEAYYSAIQKYNYDKLGSKLLRVLQEVAND